MIKDVYGEAIKKATEVRLLLNYNAYQPINIYDVCEKLNAEVRFVDVNMEGLYVNSKVNPSIFISKHRPAPRRVFTCGHELGHHIFQDGFKLDVLNSEESSGFSIEEKRADTFSAHLLMPILGISSEFIKRNIDIKQANEKDFYIISSLFSVGYSTLINHCYYNKLINESNFEKLAKFIPKRVLEKHYNISKSPVFKVFDSLLISGINIDLEIDNVIIIPSHFNIDPNYFKILSRNNNESIYVAKRVGVTNMITDKGGNFIRIQPKNYIGIAKYRHLEN